MSTATHRLHEDECAACDRAVVISRCTCTRDVDPPEIVSFSSEADFRAHVQQLLLGDVERCRAMARSFRRMVAVMGAATMRGVRAGDMGPEERRFLQRLLRARGQLCCGDAEERWLAWYQQREPHWAPPRCLNALHTIECGVHVIEQLAEPSTSLEAIIHNLQRLTHLMDGRALEVVVSEPPGATAESRFFHILL